MTHPTKKLSECLEKVPRMEGIKTKQYLKEGVYPIIDQGQEFIGGFTNDKSFIYKGKLPVVVFGDHTRIFKYVNFSFALGADGTKILLPKEDIDSRYFYFALLSLDIKTRGYSRHYRILKEIPIPLPPLEIQKKIVERVEKLMGKIDEAKKLRKEAMADASSLIPSALNKIFEEGKKKGWEEKNLEEVVEQKTSKNIKDNIPYIGMEDIESNSGRFLGNLKPKSVKSLTSYFDDSCVLYGKLRPYLNKVYIPNFEGHCSTEFIPLKPNMNYLIREWLTYWIMSPDIVKKIMFTTTGARMPRANMKRVMVFKIPLPPLPEQRKIVKYLDSLSEKIRKIKTLQSATDRELKLLEKAVLNSVFCE